MSVKLKDFALKDFIAFEIVHKGDDYLAIWCKKTIDEKWHIGNSHIEEITGTAACILSMVLPIKLRY